MPTQAPPGIKARTPHTAANLARIQRGLKVRATVGTRVVEQVDEGMEFMTYSLLCVGMRRGPSSTTKLPPAFARQVLGDPFELRLKEEQRAPVSSFFSHLRGTPRAKLR